MQSQLHAIACSLCPDSQQCQGTAVSCIAHLQCCVAFRTTAASEYVETLNESRETHSEGEGRFLPEYKLLEEAGLDERVGLDALRLLHRHLEPLATQEAGTDLQWQGMESLGGCFNLLSILQQLTAVARACAFQETTQTRSTLTSLNCTAFKMVDRFLALSILATRT